MCGEKERERERERVVKVWKESGERVEREW